MRTAPSTNQTSCLVFTKLGEAWARCPERAAHGVSVEFLGNCQFPRENPQAFGYLRA